MALIITANISGGHLNPAISLALAIHNKFPFRKVMPYILAQFLGAFFGAAIVYLDYRSAILKYSNGVLLVPPENLATAGFFATYPKEFVSNFEAFFD